MKKIKITVIILLLFILCGCSVNSNVIVNSDGSVDEKVTFDVSSDGMNKSEFIRASQNLLKNYSSALNVRNYKSEIEYAKDNGKIILSNSYSDLCQYIDNTLFSQYLYKHVSCTENDDFFEIKSETSHIDYCPDCTSWPALDNVNATFNLPALALENNASYTDKKTYIWEYNDNTSPDRNFYLKISKDDLKKSLHKKNVTVKAISILKKLSIIIGVVGGVIAIYIIINWLYKKYQSNKLQY